MFPSVRTRTRAAFLRAVDRAIEFATLGEYGLEVRPHVPHPLFRQRGGQVAARPQVCVVNAPAG